MHNRIVLAEAIVGWLVQVLGDRALRVASAGLFGRPERRALADAVDEAICDFTRNLPEDRREALARVLAERFAVASLPAGDGRLSVLETLRDGLREQLRPLADPALTPTGTSYFEQVGLDPGRCLTELPDAVIAAIQRTATDKPALAPLAAQLNADLLLAEVRALRGRSPDGRPTQRDVFALAAALQAVSTMADAESRALIIGQLRRDIADTVPYNPRTRLHVIGLVNACEKHAGGIRELVDVLAFAEGDSLPMRRVREAAVPWLGEH